MFQPYISVLPVFKETDHHLVSIKCNQSCLIIFLWSAEPTGWKETPGYLDIWDCCKFWAHTVCPVKCPLTIMACLLVADVRTTPTDDLRITQSHSAQRHLTSQFHTCWHPDPSWACSPFLSEALWSRRCWGSERTETHLWFQSNGCCCHPDSKGKVKWTPRSKSKNSDKYRRH